MMSRGRGMQMATGQDNDHRGFIDGRLNIDGQGIGHSVYFEEGSCCCYQKLVTGVVVALLSDSCPFQLVAASMTQTRSCEALEGQSPSIEKLSWK